MVVVIQSQRNSYHARRGEQRKVEILQQAADLGQVKVFEGGGPELDTRLLASLQDAAQLRRISVTLFGA